MSRTAAAAAAAEEEEESPGARLRALLTERHEAFVQEMWTLFESTVAQLEERVRAMRAEKEQQQREVSALPLCQGPVGGGETWEELTVEASESGDLPPHTEDRPECGGSPVEEPECGGLQTQETQYEDLQTDVKEEPECGDLQTEDPECGDLQTDVEVEFEYEGLPIEEPDCGGLQTEGPEGGVLQTDVEVEFEYEGLPIEEPDCGDLQTEGPEGGDLQTEGPEGGDLQTEGPEGGDLQTDEVEFEYEGLPIEEPECGDLQTEGPEGGVLQTEVPEGGDLQTDEVEFEYEGLPIEEPECGDLQTEGPEGGDLQTEGPEGGVLQTDVEVEFEYEGLPIEEPDCGDQQTDEVEFEYEGLPIEEPDCGGLQTDADEGPSGRGLQTDVKVEPECEDLQTEGPKCGDLSQNERLQRWIMKRMAKMRPMIVLSRCDAKPAEDPNSLELTENSSDSTGITQGTDTEAASDAEIRLESLLIEVIVLTDSGDEEEAACEENSQTCALEDLDVNVVEEDEQRENINQRKTLRRQVSRKTKDLQRVKKEYDCSVCGKSMISKSALRLHQQDHSSGRLFDCKYCGRMIKQRSNMVRHMNVHRRAGLSCGSEAAGTSGESASRKDAKSSMPGDFKAQASCSVRLEVSSISHLARNKKTHKEKSEKDGHTSKDKCELCLKKFPSQLQLKKHMSSHKVKGKMHCPACPKQFSFYSILKRHVACHKTRPSVSGRQCCSLCQMEFLSASKYKRHRLLHKNKSTLSSSVCGKRHEDVAALQRHQATHGGSENKEAKENASPGKMQCSLCLKTFLLMHNFYKHVLLHKTKTCLVCGRVCRTNFYVRRHMRTHTGEKPFKCPVCGKGFTEKRSLANHGVRFHQK